MRYDKCPKCNEIIPAHQGHTKTFAKLSNKEKSNSIKMMTINGMKALNIKELDGKSIEEIEKEIKETKDFNFLYELNVNDLNFQI